MGMSRKDFCACTPHEFEEAARAFRQWHEAQRHDDWERMRLLACITVQPHVKGRVTPQGLMPLPWDNAGRQHKAAAPAVSKEEQRKRFERLAKGSAASGQVQEPPSPPSPLPSLPSPA